MAFFVHKNAERCGRYVAYTLMPKHQNQFARECQLAQQHHTCHHHKDDTRYKCAYCFSQCLITGASLFREHFYRTLDNIAMLSRSLRRKTACAEPTAVFIERPPFRIIDNDICIPRPPRRHNPATHVFYHIYSKNTIYKFYKMLAIILEIAGLVSS